MRGRASLLLLLLGAFGVGAQDNGCTWCGGTKDCTQPMDAPKITHQTPNSVILEFTHDERCTATSADSHYYKVEAYECATNDCSSAGSTPLVIAGSTAMVVADNSDQTEAATTFDFDGLDPGNKCAPTRPRPSPPARFQSPDPLRRARAAGTCSRSRAVASSTPTGNPTPAARL